MNVIQEACIGEAGKEIDAAMQALENHAANGPPSLVGDAYRHILRARGQIAALQQFAELEALERAPTEPPHRLQVIR